MSYENTPFAQPVSEKTAEAYLQELIAKYPTPESIAADVRAGSVSPLAVERRFTDPEDRARVQAAIAELDASAAAEASAASVRIKETYLTPLLATLNGLPEEVQALVFGEDEYAFEESMEVLELRHGAEDEARLASLKEKADALKEAVAKDDPVAVHTLSGELKALL